MSHEPVPRLLDRFDFRVFFGFIHRLGYGHIAHYLFKLCIESNLKQVVIKLQLVHLLLFDVLIDVKLTMQIFLEESFHTEYMTRGNPQDRLF